MVASVMVWSEGWWSGRKGERGAVGSLKRRGGPRVLRGDGGSLLLVVMGEKDEVRNESRERSAGCLG
jgi:hypothetical protein